MSIESFKFYFLFNFHHRAVLKLPEEVRNGSFRPGSPVSSCASSFSVTLAANRARIAIAPPRRRRRLRRLPRLESGSTMSSTSFDSVSPLEPIPIDASLTLVPRVRLNLIVHPANPYHTKPVDDWQLKKALLDFLKNSLAVSLSVPDGDLEIRRVKDVRKRRRDEPVAHGSLVIRDLGFLKSSRSSSAEESGEERARVLEEKYADWKRYLVEKMNGMDLVLGGVKFTMSVEMPVSDSFEATRKEWEEFYAFGNRGHSRGGGRQEPDTIVLRGMPSRWFAEPRVSSKPSMLVTHTIFSTFGSIR